MNFLKGLHEATSNLTTSIYQGVSSAYEASRPSWGSDLSLSMDTALDTVTVAGLLTINLTANIIGQGLANLTGGRASLNNVVPGPVKTVVFYANRVLAVPFMRGIGALFAVPMRVTAEVGTTIFGAPIVEEFVYRLPLPYIAGLIDAQSDSFLDSTFEGVGITAKDVQKVAAAALLSIAFVYAHGQNPTPGRAAAIFTGGMALSRIQLRLGFPAAVTAHIIHNFTATRMGLSGAHAIDTSIEEERAKKKSSRLV